MRASCAILTQREKEALHFARALFIRHLVLLPQVRCAAIAAPVLTAPRGTSNHVDSSANLLMMVAFRFADRKISEIGNAVGLGFIQPNPQLRPQL